jgi:Carbohydrate binding domain/Glycosyl hydrolase family 26
MANTIAQSLQPRNDFNALLEPNGKVINGAGQYDIASFNNYWDVMNQNNKPAIFMSYIALKGLKSNWADDLKKELLSYGNKFIIPQIGLAMTEDGNPSVHYEDSVALGLYDTQINNLIKGLKNLAIPAYVRIGYEFNGLSWNGYLPGSYKDAFIRITNTIRTSNLEVATVWCFSMDGETNYMDYYPGDSYVDWWAVDIFSASDFSATNAFSFMDSATAHQKPVMIGETTPRYVGVLNGDQSWDNWFVPFFDFIHTQPAVKAFCYINWDWSQYPQWYDWGDARLEMNSVVAGNFNSELDSSIYFSSSDESTFRKTLGFSDNAAPQAPQNLSLVSANYPVELSWNAVADPSGLSHYIVYKNGELSDYTLGPTYEDYDFSAGDTINYMVSAMDRAGNESSKSSVTAYIPDTIDKAINGDFEEGDKDWNLNIYDSQASADFEIDSMSSINGKKSAEVAVNQSSGTKWHIQLAQSFKINANHQYKVKFTGKSSTSKTIEFVIQQSENPYTIYLDKQVTLTNNINTFSDSVMINTDDSVKLEFFLGSSVTTNIWIDDVSIIEYVPKITSVNNEEIKKPSEFALYQNYPNPFNPATIIRYQIPNDEIVQLKIYNILGKEVKTLVNKEQKKGLYEMSL